MAWMGSRSNVAAITAVDVSDLQDNIVFAATSELKFLMLQKTSTATVDNATVWNATPSGRWHLVGESSSTSSIEVLANLAALKALTSASQDKLYSLNTTPPILYSWDAESTATGDDDLIVKLTSVATGRMYKIYPVSGGGGGETSKIQIAANIAAITALNTTTFPDGIHYYAIAEKQTLILDKTSSSDPNDVTCWAAGDGTACWFLHPSSVVVSSTYPPSSGAALPGTTWVWAETGHESDQSLSVVTYVWRGTDTNPDQWTEVSARTRVGSDVPNNTDNQIHGQEFFVNTTTNYLYYAFRDPEFGDSWIKILT